MHYCMTPINPLAPITVIADQLARKHEYMTVRDIPIGVARINCEKLNRSGVTIWQKWTCMHCGSRQTTSEENALKEHGLCQQCKRSTEITHCGYAALFSRGRHF